MLRAIVWFTLGLLTGKILMTPKAKEAVKKGAAKAADMAQQGAEYVKKEFKSGTKKDHKDDILYRRFSL